MGGCGVKLYDCIVCGFEVPDSRVDYRKYKLERGPEFGDTVGPLCVFCSHSGGWSKYGPRAGQVSDEHRLASLTYHLIEESLDRRFPTPEPKP